MLFRNDISCLNPHGDPALLDLHGHNAELTGMDIEFHTYVRF